MEMQERRNVIADHQKWVMPTQVAPRHGLYLSKEAQFEEREEINRKKRPLLSALIALNWINAG